MYYGALALKRGIESKLFQGVYFTLQDVNLFRQWFNAVQDLNSSYLTKEDYELAIKIHDILGARVSNSVREGAK